MRHMTFSRITTILKNCDANYTENFKRICNCHFDTCQSFYSEKKMFIVYENFSLLSKELERAIIFLSQNDHSSLYKYIY